MQSPLTLIFAQLATSLPNLLVLIGGMVWVGMFWRRAPRAAMLAMAGLVLMLLSSVGSVVIQGYLVTTRPVTSFAQTMAILGFAFGMVRSAGLAFVVAAVFASRSPMVGAFPVEMSPSLPPPMARVAPDATQV